MAAILSRGFLDRTYNVVGSATPAGGEVDGVFVASSPQRAREHGDVVIAVDIDTAVIFERSGEPLIPAAELNRWPRRVLSAEEIR